MALVVKFSLCYLILILLPIFTAAQTYRNITLGSSLTASNDNSGSSWVSPSGEFAFGFRQIGDQGGFLLAIWFDKIPEKTIVWSANRDEMVQRGSKAELTSDGQLVLRDSTGKQIWSAGPGGSAVAYGAMLDSGNFVLASTDSVNLWQSFDLPTDTILPTQMMNRGSKLVSRISDSNYSSGRFMFTLQPDGNLLLYTTKYPTEEPNYPYWSTKSSIPDGFQVIFNQSGYMYLIARNGSILNNVFSNTASTRDFYQRAIIDSDGVFRQYVYPKSSASSAGKPMAWSTLTPIPSNICLSIKGETGSGACGFNSYCSLENDEKICRCPPGYTFFDDEDEMKGCKQNFVPQSCDKASEEMDLFEFREMINTDWPLSDYEYFEDVTEDWCGEVCLSDCLCAVAIFRNKECWKKKYPLSNGMFNASIGGKAMIKIRKDESTGSSSSGSKKEQNSTLIRILSALLGSSIFVNFLFLLATFVFFFRRCQTKLEKLQPVIAMPDLNLKRFTYKELEHITEGFKEELGSGAFGTVYKGALSFDRNEFVAIKKLEKAAREGEQEFKSEVDSIGRTNHKNLVRLLGFCNEGQHRLLVYEYMSNGSLANFLFGNSRPNWHNRIQIAVGTARGLLYLHEECNNQIIHCDIKPQNILLDDFLTARISDFGLAKLLKKDQSKTTTAIRGTRGYVAPEWFKSLPITVKVDVYSFGVLLLELVCCRKHFEVDTKEDQMILADWAHDCLREGKLELLVENDEEARNDMESVRMFVMIAIWCIQEDPSMRPTMKKVTQMMEGAVEVFVPPDPISFISSYKSF